MKKIIFLLSLVSLFSFAMPPVPNDPKDDWVYELEKPVLKPMFYGPITMPQFLWDNPCNNGILTIQISCQYTDVVDRRAALTIGWDQGNGQILYDQEIITIRAGTNGMAYFQYTSDSDCSIKPVYKTIGWYNPQW